MSGTKVLVVLLVVCAVIVAASLTSSTPTGTPAHDIGIMTESGEKRLSQLKGKVVLVDLWATWCGPCRMSMPGIQALYSRHHGEGFEVLGVNVGGDDPAAGLRMAKQMGITYPTGPPTRQEDVEAYEAGSIPMMVLVDKKGNVQMRQKGYSSEVEQDLMVKVTNLLKE